ncbi:MAG: CoA pyrophosphatase [Deltaproteobacteria bacterium]|nr:CoA pyrophosphatase [Deltaproteobacteria bacterium]
MKGKDLLQVISHVLGKREPRIIGDQGGRFRHASVLIPIFEEKGKYKVILTQRTNRVEEHKGQISFPGGSVDKEDQDYEETALREAREEIGLRREDVTILGRTDDTLTVASNFIIHPFVGFFPFPYVFRINRFEVKRIIQVPFDFFMERTLVDHTAKIEQKGTVYEGPVYEYQGNVIWGATARILENLVNIVKIDLLGRKY